MDERKMSAILELVASYKRQGQYFEDIVDEIRRANANNQIFSELFSQNPQILKSTMQKSEIILSKALNFTQQYNDFIEELDNAVKEFISSDYEGRCGNCHEYLQEEDLYCRYCGTKRGEGAFRPYKNIMACIYGPAPVKRGHKCPKCSYEWTNYVMVDKEEYFPKCGTNILHGTTRIEELASLFR